MLSRIIKTAVATQKWLPVLPLQRISKYENDFCLVRMASCKKPAKKPGNKDCKKPPKKPQKKDCKKLEKKDSKKVVKKECKKPEKKDCKKLEKKDSKKKLDKKDCKKLGKKDSKKKLDKKDCKKLEIKDSKKKLVKKDSKKKLEKKDSKKKLEKKDSKKKLEAKADRKAEKIKGDGEKKKRARVTIVGGCGKVGSTLALLLKQSPWIETLSMFDLKKQNCGVCMELSHIDTRCRVQAYTGAKQISHAMKDSNVVLVCAGEPRKPDMCIDDLFECNAQNVRQITECFAAVSPKAFLGIVTQPINSIVPMVCEVLKAKGCFDPKKVFGISSVNVVRATTFVAEALNMDPANVIVPVVGGHSENTVVPILSQTKPCSKLGGPETCEIIRLVKKSAGWVFELKDRQQPAILSPAYAAARFTNNLLRAMDGQAGVFDCAYIHTSSAPGIPYCTMPIELGPEGIKLSKLPKMCEHELRIFQDAICELAAEIRKGEDFILKQKKNKCER